MIFEIEGSDLTGKSTLCDKLKSKYNIDILKFAKSPLEVHDSKFSFVALGYCFGLAEMVEQSKYNVMCDRLMLSNYVYERELPQREVAVLDRILYNFYEEFDVKTLILTLDKDTLKKRFEERGDEHFSFKRIIRVNDRYTYLYEKLKPLYPDKIFDNLIEYEKEIKRCLKQSA